MVETGDRLYVMLRAGRGRWHQETTGTPVSGTGGTGHGGGTLRFLFLLWENSHQCRRLPDAFKLKLKPPVGGAGSKVHARTTCGHKAPVPCPPPAAHPTPPSLEEPSSCLVLAPTGRLTASKLPPPPHGAPCMRAQAQPQRAPGAASPGTPYSAA